MTHSEGCRNLVVYIAGPYRGRTEFETLENIRHAEKYAIKYWELGYTVICPHKNTSFLGGIIPEEEFLEGDRELIKRSDIVVFIPDWTKSQGALLEHDFALVQEKIIWYE